MSELLIDHTEAEIVWLTLNRPHRRNALNLSLIESLNRAIRSAASDSRCRVLILRGSGKIFCAGLDLHEAADSAANHSSAESLARLYRNLVRTPVLTIAAAHGGAYAGGAGLIAACDLAIIADDMLIGYPEVHRGLVPALVSCLLRRDISGRNLRELLLLGRNISAEQAVRIGLANRSVPQDMVNDLAAQLARQACAGAPGAMAQAKSLLAELDGIDHQLDVAMEFHLTARDSAEAREGMAAFGQKRPPRWPPRSA